MKAASDLIPWKVTDISFRPYEGFWSMNPSIHFDGSIWRCVLRCCDYAMPGGVTIRSKNARPMGQQTKNAMVILDPTTWRPLKTYQMHERDSLPREPCAHVGYEDMRIFKTDKGGLQGIAASLHLRRDRVPLTEGALSHQPPEQVLLSFDESYTIVTAQPIRGDAWSGTPQKNWVPFDHCVEPRFLYSIDKGVLFGTQGMLQGEAAHVKPSKKAIGLKVEVQPSKEEIGPKVEVQGRLGVLAASNVEGEAPLQSPFMPLQVLESKSDERGRARLRGGRIFVDAMSARPVSRALSRSSVPAPSRAMARRADDTTRIVGAGRVLLPKYEGLRGGTQLCCVGEDTWLGIGHEMKFVNGKKYYWHVFYLVNSLGALTAVSEPMKLAPNGIEFAAGLAIDGERVVISFGVDDMESKLGETALSAVLGVLKPLRYGD